MLGIAQAFMRKPDSDNFVEALSSHKINEFMEDYLKKNKDLSRNNVWSLGLCNAISFNQLDVMKQILEKNPSLDIFTQVNLSGRSPLTCFLQNYDERQEIAKIINNYLKQSKGVVHKVFLEEKESISIKRALAFFPCEYETQEEVFEIVKEGYLQYFYTEDSLNRLKESLDLPLFQSFVQEEKPSQYKRKFEEGSFSTSSHLSKKPGVDTKSY